jgi:hypothetical protein
LPITHYDDMILSFVTDEWLPGARIIGGVLERTTRGAFCQCSADVFRITAYDGGPKASHTWQLEPAQSLGIREHVDPQDGLAEDREAHHRKRATVRSNDGTNRAVHERRYDVRVESRIRTRVQRHRSRSMEHDRGVAAQLAAIDPEDDVGMEELNQRIEVSIAGGREERIDDLSLPCWVSIGFW